jgi:hypothetical protein
MLNFGENVTDRKESGPAVAFESLADRPKRLKIELFIY